MIATNTFETIELEANSVVQTMDMFSLLLNQVRFSAGVDNAQHCSIRKPGRFVTVSKSDEDCMDNTSKDPFSRCEICKNLGYRLSGRSQRQEHYLRHEAQDQQEAQHETQQCVQRLKTLGEHVSKRVVLQSSKSVSVLLLSPSSLAHRTLVQGSSLRLRLIPSHGHHHVACMS